MEPLEELALRRQVEEALRQALGDPAKALIARRVLQAIIDGTSEQEVRAKDGRRIHKGKRDLAEVRRVTIETAFHKRGHTAVVVPKPAASNRDFGRWNAANLALFYHPAHSQMTYEAFMASVGQGGHWTVVGEADRAKVGWENAAEGYWFTAEIASECPRLNTSWDDLTAAVKLLSLKEYAVVYWTHRDLTGERIDVSTWCWLRTRYGQGALSAGGYGGRVHVNGPGASDLSVPCECGGGRAVEVVTNAT